MSRKFVYYGAGRSADELLLDLYPATVGYSLRKLRTAYTGSAIRVRRSLDNAEQDIGFDGVGLDTTSLLSFVGAGDGYVVKIYNQGISAIQRDAFSPSSNEQHRIVKEGLINFENGKPALDSIPDGISKPGYIMQNAVLSKTILTVSRIKILNTVNYVFFRSYGAFYGGTLSGINGLGAFDGNNAFSTTGEDLNQHLGNFTISSSNLNIARDGGAFVNLGVFSQSNWNTNQVFGRRNVPIVYFQGNSQEIIMYDNDQTANKSEIETNINDYYAIY